MPEQNPLEKPAVVGEDGELLQPDMSVNPEAYSEFVATYVRRDPLWVRLQRHIQKYDGIYLFFSPWIILFGIVIFSSIFSVTLQEIMSFIFYGGFVVIFIVAVIRIAFKAHTPRQ